MPEILYIRHIVTIHMRKKMVNGPTWEMTLLMSFTREEKFSLTLIKNISLKVISTSMAQWMNTHSIVVK